MRTLIALLALSLVACGSPATDFENICNAEQRSGVTPDMEPSDRAVRIAEWLSQNLKTDEAKDTMNALAGVSLSQRAAILRAAANEAGYTGPCPMADGMAP